MNRTATFTGNRYAWATAPAKPRPSVAACAFGPGRLAAGRGGAGLHAGGIMHPLSRGGSDLGLEMDITRRDPV